MHLSNSLYWDTCKKRFPELFRNRRVVEFGSYDVNGTVRDYFEDCAYLGVDWRDGPGVDFVGIAHELDTPSKPPKFDTAISASMLEHDPYWNMSLRKMVESLRRVDSRVRSRKTSEPRWRPILRSLTLRRCKRLRRRAITEGVEMACLLTWNDGLKLPEEKEETHERNSTYTSIQPNSWQ